MKSPQTNSFEKDYMLAVCATCPIINIFKPQDTKVVTMFKHCCRAQKQMTTHSRRIKR